MNDAAFVRDRLDITNLILSYAHHADGGNTDAFGALFLDDARVDLGFPGITDKPSLMKMVTERPRPANGPKTRHVMTNLVFHAQTDQDAKGAVYLTMMSTDANKLTPIVTGCYTFAVARRDGRWGIRDWKVTLDGALG